MKKFLVLCVVGTAALASASTVFAADLDVDPPPPPVEELRPATYDWSGVSIGVFAAANALQGRYDATPICDDPNTGPIEPCDMLDPEMSGISYGGGVKIGADYQVGEIVFGVMGDWQLGGELADNDDPVEATYLNMNKLVTVRGRLGWANDDTLIYASAGLGAAEMEFGGLVGPTSVDDSEAHWTYGLAIGGGIEHALTDNLSIGLEYLHINFDSTSHFLTDGLTPPAEGIVDMHYEDFHTIRAGINWRFSM